MSMFAAIALAASGAASGVTLPNCSWDKPGVNPYMGDVVAAVDRYKDISASTRARLKERMLKRDYDEIVTIKRDSIEGQAQYGAAISEMHFGASNICKTVSRTKWTQAYEERGLVYCEEGQCILVPTVCRNVSRVQRIAPRAAGPGGGSSLASSTQEADGPLELDPTSAGPAAGPGSFAQIAGGSGFEGGPALTPGLLTPGGGFPGLGGGGGGIGGGGGGGGGGLIPTLPPGPPTPPIPEPATWALLMAGLFTVGFIARRRKAS